MSRTLGEAPVERARLSDGVTAKVADAAAFHRRISNRLVSSIITPFEADALHALACAMLDTVDAMARAAALTVRLDVSTLPNPLLEVLALVERLAERTVQGTWDLERPEKLSTFHEEMRSVVSSSHALIGSAIAAAWDGTVVPEQAHQVREVIAAIEQVVRSFERVARAVDFVRVKSS